MRAQAGLYTGKTFGIKCLKGLEARAVVLIDVDAFSILVLKIFASPDCRNCVGKGL